MYEKISYTRYVKIIFQQYLYGSCCSTKWDWKKHIQEMTGILFYFTKETSNGLRKLEIVTVTIDTSRSK